MRSLPFRVLVLLILFPAVSRGQGYLSMTAAGIHSSVALPNNFSPSTTIDRKNYFDGTGAGYAYKVSYAFRPAAIFKDRFKRVQLTIGVGYAAQRFDVKRFFLYNNPGQLLYSTDHYSYYCWEGSVGLMYNQPIGKKSFLSYSLTFGVQQSFRQTYTPYHDSGGTYSPTQTNEKVIQNFSYAPTAGFGYYRKIGGRFLAGINLLLPYICGKEIQFLRTALRNTITPDLV